MRFTSRWNWNLEMLVFSWREENRRTRRNPLGARTRTNNKLNPRMTTEPGIEPGPHWWEASALTTAPSLLPQIQQSQNDYHCLQSSTWNMPDQNLV